MRRPVCFMVMPFSTKPAPGHGDVDFDALWDRAFAPLLRELDYDPIRADQDLGSSIIADMLIRLTASDLVVADLTLANANVYYEIGVRHAARRPGCVLIAADWASPVFDVQQIRRVAYPLPAGELTAGMVTEIQRSLREPIVRARSARSPVYDLVPGYPGDLPADKSDEFQRFVGHVTEFQAAAAAIRAAAQGQKALKARELVDSYDLSKPQSPSIILELVRITRDYLGFAAVLELIGHLPADLARLPFVLEQQSLALGKQHENDDAIAILDQLIKFHGPDPERLGMLGGRYKDKWLAASLEGDVQDARKYLIGAIDSYSQGMWLDLNEYYCASNLPRLLRKRRRAGDNDLALEAADIARNACERARRLTTLDEWLNATLLGAAFDAADAGRAEQILDLILDEGPVAWKLDSTIKDLQISLADQAGSIAPGDNDRLTVVLRELEALVAPNVR